MTKLNRCICVMQQRAAAPSLSGLVLQQSALPFILLFVGLYAVAWFLLVY
jgi:hypothetical protein